MFMRGVIMNFVKKHIIQLIEIVVILAALIIYFALPQFSVKYDGFDKESFNGGGITFGTYGGFNVSFGGIFLILVVIIAITAATVRMFKEEFAFVLNMVTAAACGVSAIFLFCGRTDIMINQAAGTMRSFSKQDGISVLLGYGSIVAAVLFVLCGISAFIDQYVYRPLRMKHNRKKSAMVKEEKPQE